MAQGLGQDPGCRNETTLNETSNTTYQKLVPNEIKPYYPVQTYFIFMFILLVISTISFSFLNFSKYAIKRRKPNALSSEKRKIIFPDSTSSLKIESMESDNSLEENSRDLKINLNENEPLDILDPFAVKREKILLLSYIFILSFTCYGVLPGECILHFLFYFCGLKKYLSSF